VQGGDCGRPPKGEPIAPVAAPAGAIVVETAAETPEGGFVIGNPNAPLKLVEYGSHTCHVCAAFSQEGAAGMDKYVETGVVSYEIRNLIRDPVDLTIALLARCSGPAAFHPDRQPGVAELRNR
jgi:protein-disulfide isomerase